MKHRELRVKARSLGAEIRIIRQEEGHVGKSLSKISYGITSGYSQSESFLEPTLAQMSSLQAHRAGLQKEARLTNLVVGFFRGRKYKQIENRVKEGKPVPDSLAIHKLAMRFGSSATADQIVRWLNASPAQEQQEQRAA